MVGLRRDSSSSVVATRGQAYTLEGIVASILLLSAFLLAMNAVVITPTTEGTVDRDTTAQLGTQAGDVLAAAGDRGGLAEAALFWNLSEGESEWSESWIPGNPCPAASTGDPLTLCVMLEETFTSRFYRYNVYLDYQTTDRTTETEPLFVQGTPSRNAVTATRTVALHGGMQLTGSSGTLSEINSTAFYAENLDDETLFNVVEIRVIVW